MAIMQELYRLRDEGRLTEAQAQWFRPTKPAEELFDTEADPHELRNLANDPAYAKKLKELREACLEWVKAIDDKNLQPEEDLIREFWPNMEQPATQPPVVHFSKNEINISCATPGASIGYQIIEPGKETPSNRWMVYDKPFNTMGKKEILVIAHRIGYSPSEPVRQLIP
jgi:N-sulfoglucosamine sulfohydrolase